MKLLTNRLKLKQKLEREKQWILEKKDRLIKRCDIKYLPFEFWKDEKEFSFRVLSFFFLPIKRHWILYPNSLLTK